MVVAGYQNIALFRTILQVGVYFKKSSQGNNSYLPLRV